MRRTRRHPSAPKRGGRSGAPCRVPASSDCHRCVTFGQPAAGLKCRWSRVRSSHQNITDPWRNHAAPDPTPLKFSTGTTPRVSSRELLLRARIAERMPAPTPASRHRFTAADGRPLPHRSGTTAARLPPRAADMAAPDLRARSPGRDARRCRAGDGLLLDGRTLIAPRSPPRSRRRDLMQRLVRLSAPDAPRARCGCRRRRCRRGRPRAGCRRRRPRCRHPRDADAPAGQIHVGAAGEVRPATGR